MLTEGMKAPDFTLADQNGTQYSLKDFAGKKAVIYFYPKDNTPGCTRQACAFRDSYEEFNRADVVVIGISRDGQKSHQNFAAKYQLPFILLSDPDHAAAEAYGAWQEKKLYGKVSMGVVRCTFVVDEEGTIVRVFPKAKPDTNAAEILRWLNEDKQS